jgi:hypothetical protein
VPSDRPSRCLHELRFALAARRFALRSLPSALPLSRATQAARRAAAVGVDVLAASVLVGAFIVIAAAQLLKGREVAYSILQGAIWGFLTAVFTGREVLAVIQGANIAPSARTHRKCEMELSTPSTLTEQLRPIVWGGA